MLKRVMGILRPQSAAQSVIEKLATMLVGAGIGTALGTFLENRDRSRTIKGIYEEADRRVQEVEDRYKGKVVEEMSTGALFEALAQRVREEQLRDKEFEARRKIVAALKKAVSGNGKNDGKNDGKNVIDCAFED